MAVQPVLTCTSFTTNGDGVMTCAHQQWMDAYVVPPEQAAAIELLVQGGWDKDAYQIGFGGTLLMFAIGLGVGVIINLIRKSGR
jgi:hypothetical protein